MTEAANYLPGIRDQYESLPYPHRDPEEERTRLIDPCSDRLCNLNHYCYRGRRNFDDFRVLVAGGGTGDGTIYLALQLMDHPGARVVHLDLSTASIDVARKRAEVRGLTNIEWQQGSLLDLPTLGLGEFDYINCTGVLMILADPDAGLAALKSVLAPGGAMGLMLYARHGRTGVYQMQDLMRLVNEGEDDLEARVNNAKKVLATLPATNWFKRGEAQFSDHARWGDAGIYDLFLIEQDRAYTVPETYAFVAQAGLHLIDYCWARERLMLDPATHVRDPALLARIAAMPLPEQRAIGELISGRLTRQHFYAAPEPDRVAPPDDPDNVPSLMGFAQADTHTRMADHIAAHPGEPLQVTTPDRAFAFQPGSHTGALLRHMDGATALADIFDRVRAEAGGTDPSDAALMGDFLALYEAFRPTDSILLRHRSVPAPPEVTQETWAARRKAAG